MPLFDRHKNRIVNIEFGFSENMDMLPYHEGYAIVFITNGSASGILNERQVKITAPCILCISKDDIIKITKRDNISAQSFRFDSDFLKSTRVSDLKDSISTQLRIETGLSLFKREGVHTGICDITDNAYLQLFEWFFVLGAEVFAQSNELWACRVKRYLIQFLSLLENISRQKEPSPVDIVLDYIHTNYTNKIILNDFIRCSNLNRVSLNTMFKEKFGFTAMGYLQRYRLQIAGELLIHTDMSLNEIARSTGFEYDTYFIKQFTSKRGISPTTYRNVCREQAKSM